VVGHPADPQAGCSALLWPPRHDPVRDGRASAGSRPAGRSTPDPPSAALRVVSPGQPACHRCACGPVFAGERASALARAARLRPASTAPPAAPTPQEAAVEGWAQPANPPLPSSPAKHLSTRATVAGRVPGPSYPQGRAAGAGAGSSEASLPERDRAAVDASPAAPRRREAARSFAVLGVEC